MTLDDLGTETILTALWSDLVDDADDVHDSEWLDDRLAYLESEGARGMLYIPRDHHSRLEFLEDLKECQCSSKFQACWRFIFQQADLEDAYWLMVNA